MGSHDAHHHVACVMSLVTHWWRLYKHSLHMCANTLHRNSYCCVTHPLMMALCVMAHDTLVEAISGWSVASSTASAPRLKL